MGFPLERITLTRKHFVVPGQRVNPLYFIELEQLHLIRLDPFAAHSDQDLLWMLAIRQDRDRFP